MRATGYRYVLEVLEDGELLESDAAPLGRIAESALYEGVVRGQLPNDGSEPDLKIEPLWRDRRRSLLDGLRLSFDGDQARSYETTAFQAEALALGLVRKRRRAGGATNGQGGDRDGRAESGRGLLWQLTAEPLQAGSEPAADSVAAGRRARPLGRLRRRPYPFVPGLLDAKAAAVVVARPVLELLGRALSASREREVAHLLLGEVVHDAGLGAVQVRVRAAVPLREGRGGASSVHVAIDAGSFGAAVAEAERRADGLAVVGFAHTHPPCVDCWSKRDCPTGTVFFSDDDVVAFASAFPAPYQVAMVVGKAAGRPPSDPGFGVYGWRRAALASLGFEPLDTAGRHAPAESAAHQAERGMP